MELTLENDLSNQLAENQNNFLGNILGKAINSGINLGIRCLLPDYVEDAVIGIKDNLLHYGLKEGISKTVKSAIDMGKSAIGIFTGKFDNINQVHDAVKSGGILDNVSDLLDDVLNKVKNAGKIDNTAYKLIKNGKDSILNNVEKNIDSTLDKQIRSSDFLAKYMDNWKSYYNNHDFDGMEREYYKIKGEIKNLIPIENTINNARLIENMHKLIRNNGKNFNLSSDAEELARKLSLI